MILPQSTILAYVDNFWILAALFPVVILFVFLMKRPPKGTVVGAHQDFKTVRREETNSYRPNPAHPYLPVVRILHRFTRPAVIESRPGALHHDSHPNPVVTYPVIEQFRHQIYKSQRVSSLIFRRSMFRVIHLPLGICPILVKPAEIKVGGI
jgi:hypothetical protein